MGFDKFSTATLRDFVSQVPLYTSNAGHVIKAQYKYDNKWYVLKQRKVSELGHSKNILNEVQLLMQLNHPNVVRCFGHFWEDGRTSLYIVLEYCSGGDLMTHINTHRKASEYFDESYIWSLFYQICDGLKHLHENGIVHRDVKSLNILLTRDNQVPKLADLGVSKQMSADTTLLHTFYGTPLYLSPELIDGQHYTEKTDIWSLGVLLYELAALQMPFLDTSLVRLAQRIKAGVFAPLPSQYSRKLTHTIQWLLNVDFVKRPTISAIMTRIEPYLDVKLRNDVIRNVISDPLPPSPTHKAPQEATPQPLPRSVSPQKQEHKVPQRHGVILTDIEQDDTPADVPATDMPRVDPNRVAVLLRRETQVLRRLYQNKTLTESNNGDEIVACQSRIRLLEECIKNRYTIADDILNRFPMLRDASPVRAPPAVAEPAVVHVPTTKPAQRHVSTTVAANVHILHYDAFASPSKGIFRDNRNKHTVFAARALNTNAVADEQPTVRPRTSHPAAGASVPSSLPKRPTSAVPQSGTNFLDKGVQQQRQYRRHGHTEYGKQKGKYNIISGEYEDA